MPAPDNPQSACPEAPRVTRLEEHAGFTERTVEELAAEVRLLNTRVRELSQRLAAAEARVNRVETRGETEASDASESG